jgi:S-adenosylmethionine decarboxylase
MKSIRNLWLLVAFCLFNIASGNELDFQNSDNAIHEFKGTHLIASYCGCDQEALTDLDSLVSAMHHAVASAGAIILKSVEHVFPPYGLTMVILLSESHASIHTYPEYGACFVDLFTCGNNCSAEKFDVALREYLNPKEVNARLLVRHRSTDDR